MIERIPLRLFLVLFGVFLCFVAMGCRRNLMKISSIPSGAEVFVEGHLIRNEDRDLRMARRIDAKKERGKTLNSEETEFEADREKIQVTPVEYEFKTIGAGYRITCNKKGYLLANQVVFIQPRWYEYPPIDLLLDFMPFTVTDTREFSFDLVPEGRGR